MKIQIFVKSPKCFPHPDDVFEIPAFFRMTIKMQEQLDQNDGPLDVVKNFGENQSVNACRMLCE